MECTLILEDGTTYAGVHFGADKSITGEVIFVTTMDGYQQVITDASNRDKIILFTYPLIGTTGINIEDMESLNSHCKGIIVQELQTHYSNWRAVMSLEAYCKENDIVGIQGLDTRAIQRKMLADNLSYAQLKIENSQIQDNFEEELMKRYQIYGSGARVTVLDYGVKQSTLKELIKRNCNITVLPSNASLNHIASSYPDGILLSKGKVDYKVDYKVIQELANTYVTFGLEAGALILGEAIGAQVESLKIAQRGSNYGVASLLEDKVLMTTQNQNMTFDERSFDQYNLRVTYRNINDKSIAGYRHRHKPVEGFLFELKGRDAVSIFDAMNDTMLRQKELKHE